MEWFTIREWAQVIGKLIACEPGMDYTPLYTNNLERLKDHALKLNQMYRYIHNCIDTIRVFVGVYDLYLGDSRP